MRYMFLVILPLEKLRYTKVSALTDDTVGCKRTDTSHIFWYLQ